MSAAKHAEAGLSAIAERNWDVAITSLSKGLDQSKSPAWLLARSQAYMEKKDYPRALRDAEYAYCTAAERGNDKSRKQMIEAQYRRSVIYFRQGQYANADMCAIYSQQLAKGVAVRQAADASAAYVDEKGMYYATEADVNPKTETKESGNVENDKSAGAYDKVLRVMGEQNETKHPYDKDWKKAQAWRTTIINFLEALDKDDPRRKVTVTLVPKKPSLEEAVETQDHDPEIEAAKLELLQDKVIRPPPQAGPGPFRNQIYQTDNSITVTLFMKFPSKEDAEKVKVDVQPNLITVTNVPRSPSTAYIIPHAIIDPAKSTHRVLTMKIEFTLAKAVPGKWPSFGREEPTKPDASQLPDSSALPDPAAASESTSNINTSKSTGPVPTAPAAASKGPAYPTSSKSGPKDWDHMAVDDDEDDKDVDAFFKTLYKGATPDQQRAMMKSFQESNGTTLSTDWANVSQGPVETKPPEGVEAKKWSS